jgi:hypothetical protein
MNKTRKHGASPRGGSRGLGSLAGSPKAGPAKSGVSLCMTCLSEVEWYDDKTAGTWVPFNHGTKEIHRCLERMPRRPK